VKKSSDRRTENSTHLLDDTCAIAGHLVLRKRSNSEIHDEPMQQAQNTFYMYMWHTWSRYYMKTP